jgi:hypothetical protein
MSWPKHEQQYVDVIERVLGGVQVTSGKTWGSRSSISDLPSRGWYGVTRSSVEVSYVAEEDAPQRHDK